MNKRRYLTALALLILVLAGCAVRMAPAAAPEAPQSGIRAVRVIRPQVRTGEASLYIGMAGQYGVHAFPYQGELTPDQLIAAIGDLTGWDLRLDGPVLRDASGITVTFAADCALFTGPPEPQKEDFFVQDIQELSAVLLDSVCRTLQWNAVNPKLEDPKSVKVYFRTAAGDLTLEQVPFTQPADLPYGGLLPGAEVRSAQARLLRLTADGAAVFDLDGEELSMSPYDSDIAAALAEVTPGLSVTALYLRTGDEAVLTGIYPSSIG